ncbi:hypothetical protein [Parahaliea aestuarii]|uniref:Uncharacterized protein n=1 Tax=Parahaliea aestuarii TaxID=1852021 RepID=A0A5C8ZXQ2_9GAMM|nr:hypothetical protein [Parahaliea aestuarii]TXS93228.1 hypothetical protein FVW59_05110 [Parahaliea aestuarii]
MKAFLRENPAIGFGLGLPLLLAIVFLVISGIPALFVDPPKYDVIYATGYHSYQEGVQVAVVGGQVQVTLRGASQSNLQVPRLWRYFAASGAVQEIAITLPPNLPTEVAATLAAIPIEVADLEGLSVDPASIAPDGYEFRSGGDRSSGNIVGELLVSSRYRHHAQLVKDGRAIRLPNTGNAYYNQQTRLIGWVIEP